MLIWGWGKVTRKVIGPAFQRSCSHCNSVQIWQLCITRTWFTLFFIPIIPYRKKYCVTCPNCLSYIELTNQQFEEMKLDIIAASNTTSRNSVEDSLKYKGKTEAQINYLKAMERHDNKQAN